MNNLAKLKTLISEFGFINTTIYLLFFRKSSEWVSEKKGYTNLKEKGYKIFNPKINTYEILKNEQRISLRRFSSDILVFNQITFLDEYKAVINLIKENNFEVKTILDAGANIGLATLYFNQYFPSAKFYCIEPSNNNFIQLKKNMEFNGINSKLFKKGVWNKNTRLFLNKNFGDGREWAYSVTEEPQNTEYFEAIELNKFIKENSIKTIDILKVDVEGSEFQIFSKESDLSFLNITKSIAIEIHGQSGQNRNEILSILIEYGFEIYISGEYHIGINTKFKSSFVQ